MMWGWIKISVSSREVDLSVEPSILPSSGILRIPGKPVTDSSARSVIKPPNTTVSPPLMVTVVINSWVLRVGISFPEMDWLPTTLSFTWAILSVTWLSELISGITSSFSTTSRNSMFEVMAPPRPFSNPTPLVRVDVGMAMR